MTRDNDDQELLERIRRATDHFTFERPMPTPQDARRNGRAVRFGSLVAAAAFGAAVTLVALAVLRPQGPPTGSHSQTQSPSQTGPASTPNPESPAPRGTEVPLDAAQRTCLAAPGSIPDGWLSNGESAADINARFASLQLAHEEQRSHAALFVFADERFLVLCEIGRRTDGQDDFTLIRALRDTDGAPMGYSGGTNLPASVDDAGNRYVADLVMYGPAAANVRRVDVLLEDGSTVEASLSDGVWVGWWNRSISAIGVRATLADGSTFPLDATMKAVISPAEESGAPANPEASTVN
jgi:hypothetical protein